jgi:hypothetical protein
VVEGGETGLIEHAWMDGGKGRVLDFGVGAGDIHPTGKESNIYICSRLRA